MAKRENRYVVVEAGTLIDLESCVSYWVDLGYIPCGTLSHRDYDYYQAVYLPVDKGEPPIATD